MLRDSDLELFHDSYERCREKESFFDIFYDRFLSASDEIQQLFQGVDLSRVKRMVRDATIYLIMASDGSRLSIKKVESLSNYHHELGVKSAHYDLWLDALMSVVEEVDPKYNQAIDEAWRAVMKIGLDMMKAPQEPK